MLDVSDERLTFVHSVQGSFAPHGMGQWETAVRSFGGTHNVLHAPPQPIVASLVNVRACNVGFNYSYTH